MDPQKLSFLQVYWAGDSDISVLIGLSLQAEPCLAESRDFSWLGPLDRTFALPF